MINVSSEKKVVFTTIRDVTPLLEVENQKNLIKLRTTAFGSAAHELKNPLNAINSSLELLDGKLESPGDRALFETARNCSKLMLFLIRDFLDFTQLEAASFALNLSEFDLFALLQEIAAIFGFTTRDKGIELRLQEAPAERIVVRSDNSRLKQIVINLVSNAIKYTRVGFVKLSAETRNTKAVISVEDTGVGMSPDQLDKLFVPFTKIQENRELNREGVGLGLAISKNIARALKGRIEAESTVGTGTTFTVTIPIDIEDKKRTAIPA